MSESLSEYAKIPLGQEVESFDVSPKFNGYSGIEITDENGNPVLDEKGNPVLVGDNTGRIISIPGITKEQAEIIRDELKGSAFRYQPHETQGALLNPAAELGDGVTVNSTYSGIYKMEKRFTPKMDTDISAPYDEEIDHEYPYQPKQDRVYQRAIAENKSQISLTQKQVSIEVSRAKGVEGELSSAITSTAETITAKVNKKVNATNNSSSTFGWNLKSDSWELFSDNTTVFKADKDGVAVTGRITAKSGIIGGFTIGSNSITTNGQTWNGHKNGIYIGNNGIQLGSLDGSYFWASQAGNVVAKNMTLTGTLKIGGTEITAAALRSGAASAYGWANTKDSSGMTQAGRWSAGAGYGYNYNAATDQNSSSYPSYFKAGTLLCDRIRIGGHVCGFITATIDGVQRSVLMALT